MPESTPSIPDDYALHEQVKSKKPVLPDIPEINWKYKPGEVLTHIISLTQPVPFSPPRLYVIGPVGPGYCEEPYYECRVLAGDHSGRTFGPATVFAESELVPLSQWLSARNARLEQLQSSAELLESERELLALLKLADERIVQLRNLLDTTVRCDTVTESPAKEPA